MSVCLLGIVFFMLTFGMLCIVHIRLPKISPSRLVSASIYVSRKMATNLCPAKKMRLMLYCYSCFFLNLILDILFSARTLEMFILMIAIVFSS
jgi:hypothetical protein